MPEPRKPIPPVTTREPRDWPATEAGRIRLGALLILLAVGVAYLNSLAAPFLFDDIPNIVLNPSIRHLWPPGIPLQPPGGGHAVAGRPVVNLSLALNYALGGQEVRGYHVFNLLVHAGAALLLYGVVRRTLVRPGHPEWMREAAQPLAFYAAMLWALHPLQTESVTFIIQRTESLAGLVYLGALYAFIRGTGPGARAGGRWLGLAVAACFVGMATKEIVATAPLIIFLYDRTFVAGSFGQAWRERRWFYVAAAASWGLLAFMMAQTGGRGGTASWGEGVGAWESLLLQSRTVVMYLRLAFWPHPLVVDYGEIFAEGDPVLADVWPQFALLVALGLATLAALVRRPRVGFLGAWFFVILAPSSSFIPLLSQIRAEHRMYLPLAAVVVAVAMVLHRRTGRAAPFVAGLLVTALGLTTVARNHDYRTARDLWTETVKHQPDNPRAHFSLGLELEQAGEKDAAMREYEEAVRLEPPFADAHVSLAELLSDAGRETEAREHMAAAVRFASPTANARNGLGQMFYRAGDLAEAAKYFAAALQLDPDHFLAHNNLGDTLFKLDRVPEAIEQYRRAVALMPDDGPYLNLALALDKAGRKEEAIASVRHALRLNPDDADARALLDSLGAKP